MKFKVVISSCYGGFGLSDEAWRMLAKRRSLSIEEAKSQYLYLGTKTDGSRSCPHLIAVVEKLGDEANGPASELEVVELQDSVGRYMVDEYDGWESVITPAMMEKRWSITLNSRSDWENESCNEGD